MAVKDNITKEDIALDLMQNEDAITEEELRLLDDDEEVLNILRDAKALRGELRGGELDNDVEERLARFHQCHDGEGRNHRRLRSIVISVASVAAVILAIFLLRGYSDKPNLPKGAQVIYQVDKSSSRDIIVKVGDTKQNLASSASSSTAPMKFENSNNKPVQLVAVYVPAGETYDITLPDGTAVYMHQNSKIMFPSRFTNGNRNVTFEGEAYFKVHKDPAHPFIVRSGQSQIRVLGTEFNLKSYKDQPTAVTLISGSVAFTTSTVNKTLKPGEQLLMNNETANISNVDVQPFIFWRDGFLYYDDMPFEEVLRQIGKIYNYSIVSYNHEAMSLKVRFIAKRSKDIKEVLQTINDLEKVQVELKDGVIIVR
jgi:ferric-dicitrate binding protein FerR (iron transport regulator)